MDWELTVKKLERQAKQMATLAGDLTTDEDEDQKAANAVYLEVYEARCSMMRAIATARVAALAAEKGGREDE